MPPYQVHVGLGIFANYTLVLQRIQAILGTLIAQNHICTSLEFK